MIFIFLKIKISIIFILNNAKQNKKRLNWQSEDTQHWGNF
jgi:hypothetical protein